MSPTLSPNTQAILLLTAPLIVGRAGSAESPLTAGDYSRLAAHLRDLKRQPSDLLAPHADDVIHDCQALVDGTRMKRLLGRGFLLSQALERWHSRAIWVISRADPSYPRRLKARLAGAAPAVLYGCGSVELLETGGLAVVGSRNVNEALIAYTEAIGRLSAEGRQTIVSGGARGVDQASMRGALLQGGNAIGVLGDSLEKAAIQRDNRAPLLEQRLVLVSPYDPNAAFNVGHAMQRNKLIYALSDAALVVNSDLNKGGTWAGAIEQLTELKYVPIYIRSTGDPCDALEALRQKGAEPWPNPVDADGISVAVRATRSFEGASAQAELPLTNIERQKRQTH
jgi:predicted Rossmann fold nucleotide-binding protein DprA/Smf involved in DNA uptake